MRIAVELLPQGPYADTVIVIDVLRATTTAAVYLESGASEVHFACTLEEALASKAPGVLLAGERGGLPPAGFDLGNSPLEAQRCNLNGLTVVMSTSNGTRATHLTAASAKTVLLGSLRNAHATARRALALATEEIAIVCAGREGRVGIDDTYTAGVLCQHLISMVEAALDDGARIALDVRRQAAEPSALLASSAAGLALERVGLGADIPFCAEISQTSLVPTLVGRAGPLLRFAAS